MIDSIKKMQAARERSAPKLADDGQAIWIDPAYSIREDPDNGKDYGNHGMQINFGLRRGDRAVTTEFYTSYDVTPEMSGRHMDISPHMLCTGLYYHFHTKEAGVSEYAHEHNGCLMFNGGKCWGEAGSALHGDDIEQLLLHGGSGAVFEELERAIREDFEPESDSTQPQPNESPASEQQLTKGQNNVTE